MATLDRIQPHFLATLLDSGPWEPSQILRSRHKAKFVGCCFHSSHVSSMARWSVSGATPLVAPAFS